MSSKNQWIILLLLILGIWRTFGKTCSDISTVQVCTNDLMNYETSAFPFYGENEAKLQDTCGNINASFECVASYIEECNEKPDCDETCKEQINIGSYFLKHTGLSDLAKELCAKKSYVQEIYLQVYECIKTNSEIYSECHNTSEKSQDFLKTIQGVEAIHKTCCYFSWFRHCFIDITEKSCGKNATSFIDFAWQTLIGRISAEMCKEADGNCDGNYPPLSSMDGSEPEGKSKGTNPVNDKTKDKAKSGALWTKSTIFITIIFSLISYLNIVKNAFCI